MSSEQKVRNLLEMKFAKNYHHCILWANPSGNGVVGNILKVQSDKYLIQGRRAKFGGPDGASDFLGNACVKITPEMVGQFIGVLIAIETKPEDWTPPTIGQKKSWKSFTQQFYFIRALRDQGALAGFARCNEDIVDIMEHGGINQEKILANLLSHINHQESRNSYHG